MAAYDKLIEKDVKEYQGESYSAPITKGDLTVWLAEDTGYHELLNSDGDVISTGALVHTTDDKGLEFFVPKTDTDSILGFHRLLIHLTNTNNAEFDDVIAEFEIVYSQRKA